MENISKIPHSVTYTDERARAQIMPFLPPRILGSRRYGAPHGRTEKDFHCVLNKQDKVRSVVFDKKYSPWTEGTHQNAHVGHECMQTNTTWPIDMNSLEAHHP